VQNFVVFIENWGRRARILTSDFALAVANYYTCLTALCPGLPRWASTRKVKLAWIYWSKR